MKEEYTLEPQPRAGALTLKPWGVGRTGASDSNADISEVRLKLRCKQLLALSPLSTAPTVGKVGGDRAGSAHQADPKLTV